MPIKSLLLFFMLIMTGPFFASQALGDDIDRQLKGCTRACFAEGEKCLSQAGVSQPFCDTHEISCASSCQTCISSFASCMNIADHAVSFCQNVFASCIDEKLSANRSREHVPVLFKGGDGRSLATPVVIEGALSDTEIALAENLWMFRKHSSWKQVSQSRLRHERRVFDKIEYQSDEGAQTIWFDVTAGLGN